MGAVAGGHELLEVMSGDQLVVDRGACEVAVVAAQAHELVAMFHPIGRKRDADDLAAGEVRIHLLPCGRHHFDAPEFLGEIRNRDQIAFFEELDGFLREFHDQFGLLAGADVLGLDVSEGFLPVPPEAELT